MAEAVADTTELATVQGPPNFLPGMSGLSIFKQIGLMIGIAASVALGVFIVLWGSEPEMRPIGQFDAATSMEVVSYLEQANQPYRIDSNGMIHIPADRYQRLKMELASQGYQVESTSDALLSKDSGFGVSQRLEQARLKRSQELQLAKTISEFSGVRAAKVHLAIPKESAFLKHKRQPSASVLLNLFGSRPLEEEQVRAIVDLVTGSVANLERKRVTVTDQFGRLLHSGSQSVEEMETQRELKLIRERQAEYQRKVEQILLPIVGDGNYTVQVTLEMDFTKTEQTQQVFNPELPAVRSERTLEDRTGGAKPSGVPGALSNQPPAASNIPETLQPNAANNTERNASSSARLEAERNYDLDTTISHIKQQVGIIDRISVSIGLDYIPDPSNPEVTIPRDQNAINNITRLVRGAIGYNPNRGDLVEIESFQFVRPEALPDPEPLPFYEQPLFKALWKPVTAILLGLVFIFALLRPFMNKMMTHPPMPEATPADDDELGLDELEPDELSLEGGAGREEALQLPSPGMAGSIKLEQAKGVVNQDPALVAQLVKGWVEEDE